MTQIRQPEVIDEDGNVTAQNMMQLGGVRLVHVDRQARETAVHLLDCSLANREDGQPQQNLASYDSTTNITGDSKSGKLDDYFRYDNAMTLTMRFHHSGPRSPRLQQSVSCSW